jgi:hypothetical protein
MKENTVKNIMVGLIIVGIIMILIGLYLAISTNISTSKGTDGIFTIAGFIAGGLFVSVPAKIYLTLQLMKFNDENVRAKNEAANKKTKNT